MGEDISVTQFLADLPNNVLVVNVDDRPSLFKTLSRIILHYGIKPVDVRLICKAVATTLTRYRDSTSQMLVRNIIVDMLNAHHDAAIENIMTVFKVLSVKELPNAPVSKASKAALIALGWSVLLNKHCDINSNLFQIELARLVEYQSTFHHIVLISANNRLIKLANVVLHDVFGMEFYSNYYENKLLKSEPQEHVITTLLLLLKFKNDNKLLEQKYSLIDMFIKATVTPKTKPNPATISSCSLLLNSLSYDDFVLKFLPPLQRAVLRNPELVLHVVGLIIQEVKVDLSPCASSLSKQLIPYLYSKDQFSRSESVEALTQLSLKCSKAEVIEDMINTIFNVFHGSEGKISVAEHRMNLLQLQAVCRLLTVQNLADRLVPDVSEVNSIKPFDLCVVYVLETSLNIVDVSFITVEYCAPKKLVQRIPFLRWLPYKNSVSH